MLGVVAEAAPILRLDEVLAKISLVGCSLPRRALNVGKVRFSVTLGTRDVRCIITSEVDDVVARVKIIIPRYR